VAAETQLVERSAEDQGEVLVLFDLVLGSPLFSQQSHSLHESVPERNGLLDCKESRPQM
jgi:hypothetical protein